MVAQPHRPRIQVICHDLDPFHRARREKIENPFPVEWRPIAELKREAVIGGDRAAGQFRGFPKTRRRHSIAATERVVESTQAREPTRERNFADRQCRFRQELFREQQPSCEEQLDRRHAEFPLNDSADLP